MGNTVTTIRAAWDQAFPPKPTFSTDQMPDLTGRIALVTGIDKNWALVEFTCSQLTRW